jgi:hypothetical protein
MVQYSNRRWLNNNLVITDEETKGQRRKMACHLHASRKDWDWNLHPVSLLVGGPAAVLHNWKGKVFTCILYEWSLGIFLNCAPCKEQQTLAMTTAASSRHLCPPYWELKKICSYKINWLQSAPTSGEQSVLTLFSIKTLSSASKMSSTRRGVRDDSVSLLVLTATSHSLSFSAAAIRGSEAEKHMKEISQDRSQEQKM